MTTKDRDDHEIAHRPPTASPIQPVELSTDSEIQFDCHRGVACFNACCKNIDIVLTPYDILRLKRRLKLRSSAFVARYTVPYPMDHHEMPGLKMRTKPGTEECVFLTRSGCGVYDDRPAACRYYALGSMGVRKKDSADVEDVYFIVKEVHCLGHDEPRRLTVGDYRREQGVDEYDDRNRQWRDIVLKKRSGGPTVGAPPARSLQLFDMCSYDIDSFREFVQTPGFEDIFDLEAQFKSKLLSDEDALFEFAMRFLKQVLFGEMTIPIKEGARERRLARRRAPHAALKAKGGKAQEN